MAVFCVNKPEGQTPLESIHVLQESGRVSHETSVTYAGRLDPLASGLMLLLSGEDISRKSEFQDLEKEYDVSILFGFSTDTGDILGKITNHELKSTLEFDFLNTLEAFKGVIAQAYPMYSSKSVQGIPLWSHARRGNDVGQPVHDVTIHSIEFHGFETISSEKLQADILRRIGLVSGDFRQEEILNDWKKLFRDNNNEYQIAHIRVTASSGTYMRVLAEDIGKHLGIPALAYRIHRNRVGEYSLGSASDIINT